MIRLGSFCLWLVFLLNLAGVLSLQADSSPAPDFKEVYDLIQQHLAGINDVELNRAAVQGLLAKLGPKVTLVGPEAAGGSELDSLVSKSSLFDGPLGYIRVRRVADGLDKAVREAWQNLASTNKLNGVVLDLRYADGTDYGAAVATASLFARKDQAVLDWGHGMARTKESPDNITVPLAVLVNEKTTAAAEALAAALREIGAGLILGSRTAGQATIAEEYPLKNGEHLRIATTSVQLGDGSPLSPQGIKPDIATEVAPTDELAYYADPFKELLRNGAGAATASLAAGTNRIRRPRFNEAELVRERRDGVVSDSDAAESGANESEKPAVHDPVLARALDFLKGLSVMRQTRF